MFDKYARKESEWLSRRSMIGNFRNTMTSLAKPGQKQLQYVASVDQLRQFTHDEEDRIQNDLLNIHEKMYASTLRHEIIMEERRCGQHQKSQILVNKFDNVQLDATQRALILENKYLTKTEKIEKIKVRIATGLTRVWLGGEGQKWEEAHAATQADQRF